MRRSAHTVGRQERRARLWLKRDTWAALDAEANKNRYDKSTTTLIETICEEWSLAQLHRAAAAARRYDQRDGTTTQDDLAALAAGVHILGSEVDDLAAREARADAWEKSLNLDDDE